MQSDKSTKRGARTHHPEDAEAGEVLTPGELDRRRRGQELKRVVRSAGAMHDLYDDSAIAEATGRTRNAVAGWWLGARPDPDSLRAIADVTGLDFGDLIAFVYGDGQPPIPAGDGLESGFREGTRLDQERPQLASPPAPEPSARPPRRGSGAGSA